MADSARTAGLIFLALEHIQEARLALVDARRAMRSQSKKKSERQALMHLAQARRLLEKTKGSTNVSNVAEP